MIEYIYQIYQTNALFVYYTSDYRRVITIDGFNNPYYPLTKTQQKFMNKATKYLSRDGDGYWLDDERLGSFKRLIEIGYINKINKYRKEI